jgi:hypothetical protein
MTTEEFQRSLSTDAPPASLTPALTALWWDAKGNWENAHSFAQDDEGSEGRGCTRTCIARKAIAGMLAIGIGEQGNRSAKNLCLRSG